MSEGSSGGQSDSSPRKLKCISSNISKQNVRYVDYSWFKVFFFFPVFNCCLIAYYFT